jgi:hypothetical protein
MLIILAQPKPAQAVTHEVQPAELDAGDHAVLRDAGRASGISAADGLIPQAGGGRMCETTWAGCQPGPIWGYGRYEQQRYTAP